MTKRQMKFCEEYKKDQDAVKAAVRAGYSEKSAAKYAWTLMRSEEIRKRLELDGDVRDASGLGDEALRLLSAIARGETTEKIVCKDGEIRELPPGVKDRLKAIELIEKRLGGENRDDGGRVLWIINDDL